MIFYKTFFFGTWCMYGMLMSIMFFSIKNSFFFPVLRHLYKDSIDFILSWERTWVYREKLIQESKITMNECTHWLNIEKTTSINNHCNSFFIEKRIVLIYFCVTTCRLGFCTIFLVTTLKQFQLISCWMMTIYVPGANDWQTLRYMKWKKKN
jgi:hypothetical protein